MNHLLALCGFMGCGKTTVGKALAERLRLPFLDLDDDIRQATRQSIAALFDQLGEEGFRRLETRQLRQALESDTPGVLALGGGCPLSEQNAALLRQHTTLLLLDTPFELCYERILADEGRPLAYQKTKEELWRLYRERRPVYLERCDGILVWK